MATVNVLCIKCGNDQVKKIGYTPKGKQRYLCKNQTCKKSFLLDYSNKSYQPDVKDTIIDMTLNGSGIRGIS